MIKHFKLAEDDELLMSALLNELSLLHHHDLVRSLDGRESVGGDDRCDFAKFFSHFVDGFLHFGFVLIVQDTCCFVANQLFTHKHLSQAVPLEKTFLLIVLLKCLLQC